MWPGAPPMVDAVYDAVTPTAAVAPGQVWPELQICWCVNNVPTSGGATGQIGTTFYAGPDPNTGIHQIFVLGAANVDTDEFDSHVIAHEWGHYFQNVVSRDDSTGGPHSSGDYLDLRIAFSEGWGNAWSGIALGDPIYRDSGGASQQSGFAFDVSSAPASAPIGWYGEDTNQYLIYTLDQQLGFGPIFHAISGAVRTNLPASSMFSFASALKGVVTPTNAAALDAMLLTQNMHAAH